MRVAIIGGSGKMGRWFANFLLKDGKEVVITGRNEGKLLEAQQELLESQYELTRASWPRRPLDDSPWLLPTTQPHCGPYLLKLEAQPRHLVESWPMRRLAATIPGLADGLARQAAAVVQTDSSRAAVTAAYQSGSRSLDQVLQAIHDQTRQTLAFLEIVGAYNRAIVQYALAVLPATISDGQLVGTLVLE